MKLQHLSMLVSAIIMTGSVGATEVYNKDGNKLYLFNKLNGIHYMSNNSADNGDHSFILYGLKGESQLSDELTGFGTWKQEFQLRQSKKESGKNNFNNIGYVGLKFADIGSIDYGRNYGVLYDIGSWTNTNSEFGGDTSINDNFMSSLASSVLTYRNNNFFGLIDGFNVALQYQGKNENKNKNQESRSLLDSNGDGYGLSVIYNLGNGVSAGAAYSSSNLTVGQRLLTSDNKDKRAAAYSLGLKYNANNLYLAALYNETRNMTAYGNLSSNVQEHKYNLADIARNLELIAQYEFDCGLRPSIGYLQSLIDNKGQNKSNDFKKYVDVGASYNFNKSMLTFIDYRINLLSKNDFTRSASISTDNILALGINYTF